MREIIKAKEVNNLLLQSTNKIAESIRHVKGEVGWHQHLQAKKIGIVATSIALLLLNRQKKAFLERENAYKFVIDSQNPDGGWAYISNLPDKSNTESTCWALRALNIDKDQYPDQIENGIKWLLSKIEMDTPDDSGWGFVGITHPRVYNTCLVLRTLSELKETSSEAFESGIQWLRNCQNSDGGWGEIKGSQSGLFYTSYTIVSLITCATPINDPIIVRALDWLETKVYEIGINSPSTICTLEFIEENGDGKKSRTPFFHFTIPHIVEAFIKTGHGKKRIVFEGIQELIKSNTHGYWKHPFLEVSKLVPIWAIYDSMELFQGFVDGYKEWNSIHHFRIWRNKIRRIRKYSPVRIWDKINPEHINFILTVIIIVLAIRYSLKIYQLIPEWLIAKIDGYVDFLLSIFASIVASLIIYIINPLLRNVGRKKNSR